MFYSTDNAKPTAEALQIFDLLQISRLEKESGERFRLKMKSLSREEMPRRQDRSSFLSGCHALRLFFLKRQAQDAALLYLIMRRERQRSFGDYMKAIPRHANDARALKTKKSC